MEWSRDRDRTHELEDGHFHHALVEVRRLVLHDLHRDDLVRLHILTLDHLTERALTQDVQNEVPKTEKNRRQTASIEIDR